MRIKSLEEKLEEKDCQLQGEIEASEAIDTQNKKDKLAAKLKLEFKDDEIYHLRRNIDKLQDKVVDYQLKNEELKKEIEELRKYNECPICMEYIDIKNDMIVITACGHRLCYNCAKQIRRCPICQKTYTILTDVVKLY